jgi:hypothetical protein
VTAELLEPGPEVLVELDARRRVSLGRHNRYLGHEETEDWLLLWHPVDGEVLIAYLGPAAFRL